MLLTNWKKATIQEILSHVTLKPFEPLRDFKLHCVVLFIAIRMLCDNSQRPDLPLQSVVNNLHRSKPHFQFVQFRGASGELKNGKSAISLDEARCRNDSFPTRKSDTWQKLDRRFCGIWHHNFIKIPFFPLKTCWYSSSTKQLTGFKPLYAHFRFPVPASTFVNAGLHFSRRKQLYTLVRTCHHQETTLWSYP